MRRCKYQLQKMNIALTKGIALVKDLEKPTSECGFCVHASCHACEGPRRIELEKGVKTFTIGLVCDYILEENVTRLITLVRNLCDTSVVGSIKSGKLVMQNIN